MSRQKKTGAGVVIAQLVGERPDQRDVSHHLGSARQMLADVQARHAGADRFELAPHFARRIGLRIERVEMAGSTIEPNENARVGFGGACFSRRRGARL